MAPASQPPTTTTLRAFLVTALAARGGSARRGDRSEREIFGLSSQCCREPWEPRTAEVPVMAATGGMTVPAIVARKGDGVPLVMVTAYDAPSARQVDAAGVDVILVGDTLAMVVLGYEDTLQVTI